MKDGVLREEAQERVREIGHADIVVGIPSYNNAGTIGHVVETVRMGLARYYPLAKSVIVNADGASTDGTPDLAAPAAAGGTADAPGRPGIRAISTPYQGIPGKGSAVRTILELACDVGASACAVVDADLRSITPEWVGLLIGPVTDSGFDYVAPLYRRHKYDGTITNSVIYPLTRALYGKCVRQPIGGDFGFSGRLARFYLSKRDVWESSVARFGIDVWVTTTAIAEGFRVCQSFLGSKIHDFKDPGVHLATMLYQVVGAAFDLMETYAGVWKRACRSESVQTFGVVRETPIEPVAVNVPGMMERFRLGAQELADLWETILGREIVSFLKKLASLGEKDFFLPDDLWTEIIYRSAVSAHRKVINKEHLLKSLATLYIGRTASFVIETRRDDAAAVEEKIERLCLAFEEKKPFLVKSWEQDKEVSPCTT
jgi:glycosyltransferase involved in cell wall biosynthesis